MARHHVVLVLMLALLASQQAQMIVSYGMRKLAMSMNQFGLDMLRHQKSNTTNVSSSPSNIAFCSFCVGSSLAMVLAGLWPDHRELSAYESLRYALYLNSMQPQEIHLAMFDLMRHLQVNMPEGIRLKRSTNVSLESTQPELYIEDELLDADSREQARVVEETAKLNSIDMVSNVYIQRYLPVDYEYYVLMQQYYRTPIRSLDFAFAPEESRQHINAMVEHATGGKVANLLRADDEEDENIDSRRHRHFWPTTKLLLVSALYFDGKLDLKEQAKREAKITLPFLKSRRPRPRPEMIRPLAPSPSRPPPSSSMIVGPTQLRLPVTDNTTIVQTNSDSAAPSRSTTTEASITQSGTVISSPPKTFNPFKPYSSHKVHCREWIRLRYAFSSYLNATAVEMPFVGGILSLVVLVPGDGRSLDTILARLSAQLLADVVQNLEIRRMDITLPSLNIGHTIADMENLLSRMGLASVFDDRRGEGRATKFAGIAHFPLAQLSRIHHKTMLNIDIDGGVHARRRRRRRREVSQLTELVASPVIRVFEQNGGDVAHEVKRQHQSLKQIATAESNIKPSYVHPKVASVVSSSSSKRSYVNLDDQNFVYFILDNISGLVLVMGKYEQTGSV